MPPIEFNSREVLEQIERGPAQKVKVAITDIDGVLRGKYIHREKFLSAAESGFGFCNVVFGWDSSDVCYDNVRYTGWHSGYPDALARLDLRTYRHVPWDHGVPFFLGEFVEADGQTPLGICPRQLLKKVVRRAHDMGFVDAFGMEFEWFNFKETPQSLLEKGYMRPQPLTPGMFGYSLLRASHNQPFMNALMDELLAFRVPIEGLHTETGPGVIEAAILYSDALEAGDRAVLFKASAKEIGARFGIMPSFMAKWNEKLPGCSGHIHQSLRDKNGDNVFYDAGDPHKMSALFRHYVAGQIQLLPELLPFFAPTVNSYKRLVEGAWAPTRSNWGIDNRTTALRVIPGSAKSTRLETRVSGSDVNPYLALAAALGSGLYGIEHKLELTAPVIGSGYADQQAPKLPSNLHEAATRLSNSQAAREIFGEEFLEHYAATRQWEWRQSQAAVTSWEMERYFEII
ncbi:MAG TPA: glutamine synthetase family protein [Polyangiaceae bacterium]|nr:glutamine synthetase family protein [Polyangiaceae bacterium]